MGRIDVVVLILLDVGDAVSELLVLVSVSQILNIQLLKSCYGSSASFKKTLTAVCITSESTDHDSKIIVY
jgi:hypothetical protein